MRQILPGVLEGLVQPGNEPLLCRRVHKARLKTVARQRVGVLRREARGGKGLGEVLVDIATKIRRTVHEDNG